MPVLNNITTLLFDNFTFCGRSRARGLAPVSRCCWGISNLSWPVHGAQDQHAQCLRECLRVSINHSQVLDLAYNSYNWRNQTSLIVCFISSCGHLVTVSEKCLADKLSEWASREAKSNSLADIIDLELEKYTDKGFCFSLFGSASSTSKSWQRMVSSIMQDCGGIHKRALDYLFNDNFKMDLDIILVNSSQFTP